MYGSAASGGVYDPSFRPEKNISKDYLSRWKNPGDEKYTNIPAIISSGTEAYWRYSTHYSYLSANDDLHTFADNYWDMYDYSNIRVVSANYIKCQSLNVTYEIPERLLSKYYISRLAINASAYNLFTISHKDLKGQTPNQGGFTNIQLSDRPSFSLGLNLTF